MKKHWTLLIGLLLGMLILTGCLSSASSVSKGLEPTSSETVNNLDKVTMSVKSITPTGLTVVMENKSDKDCLYGEYFYLETKSEGTWYQVNVKIDGNYGFNDIGYYLPAGELSEWEVDWEWLYGSLEAGEYRIIKDVSDFRGTGDYDSYYLAAEFEI